MYVNYSFYQGYGDLIPRADWSKVEPKAEAAISYLTYVNGDIFAVDDCRVKRAVCAAAEVIYNNEQQASAAGGVTAAGKRSESNDGYSVTYVTEAQDGQTAEEALRKKIAEAVRIYLLPTGWLSRKVKMGGCCDVCADCDHSL